MIISTNRTPYIADFEELVDNTTEWLNRDAANQAEYYIKRNAQLLEDDVIKALNENAQGTVFAGTITKISGQKFPDIVAKKYYGVEVKSSKDDKWQNLGGSINESTRVESVDRIFLTFGKLVSPVEFRSRPYEDCLSGMAVTHYPRYKIDMNLPKGETLFDKMGTTYDELRTSNYPVERVVDYYKSKMGDGERLWWAGGDEISVEEMKLTSTSTFTADEKNAITALGLALFPELLSNSQTKYEQLVLYLATEHRVVSSNIRDYFSAGGREDVSTSYGTFENLQRVIVNVHEHKNAIEANIRLAKENELMQNWKVNRISGDRIAQWIDCVCDVATLENYDILTVLNAIFDR